MAETNTYQNMEQQPTTQPAVSGDQSGAKMFTQDDVNRIVSDRLARERAKTEPAQADERETRLNARESRLNCREYLIEKGYSQEFLDMLDTRDVNKFKAAADKLVRMATPPAPPYAAGTGMMPYSSSSLDEALSKAFKPQY